MNKTLRLLALLLALLPTALPHSAAALDADEMFEDPAMEARAREIGRELRCLKCRNQSIFDSNAGIAKDLRVAVRERIVAGDSDQEVLDYVHERFGDFVLLKPPVKSTTYALWLAPFVIVLVGAFGTVAYLRKPNRTTRPAEMSDDDRDMARRILEGKES